MRKLIVALLAAGAASPAWAAPVGATVTAQATAKVIRPLSLTATGALNFGTIILNGVTANRSVSLSTAGVLNCGGGSPELACSGATGIPTYNVRGTSQQTVTIIKTASTLTNGSGGSLTLTPIGPASIVIPNSGAPGVNFAIGGSITLTPATADGVYSGTVNVQVDYQ